MKYIIYFILITIPCALAAETLNNIATKGCYTGANRAYFKHSKPSSKVKIDIFLDKCNSGLEKVGDIKNEKHAKIAVEQPYMHGCSFGAGYTIAYLKPSFVENKDALIQEIYEICK